MAWYDFLTGATNTGSGTGFSLGSLDKALLGAGLGAAASSGTTTTTQTANKDPWAPAQDWLKYNLGLGRNLQDQYMKNPFSGAQQAAYNNSAALGGQSRNLLNTIAPQMSAQQFYTRQNPVKSVSPYNFGITNFQQVASVAAPSALSATTVDGSKYVPPPPAPVAPAAPQTGLLATPSGGGGSSGGSSSGSSGTSGLAANGGLGVGDLTDGINSNASAIFKQYAPVSVIGAGAAALANKQMTQAEALDAINASADPLGALIKQQGWTPETATPAPVAPAPVAPAAPVFNPSVAPPGWATTTDETGSTVWQSANGRMTYQANPMNYAMLTGGLVGGSGGGGGNSTAQNFGLNWGGLNNSSGFGSDASA